MNAERNTSKRSAPLVVRVMVLMAILLAIATSPLLEHLATDSSPTEQVAAGPLPVVAPTPAAVTSTTAPAVATTSGDVADAVSAASAFAPALQPAVALGGAWRTNLSPDYVVTDVGCASDLSAAGLAAFFAMPLGAIQGFDAPRITALGDGRNLWIVQDTFIDNVGGITSFAHMDYANSTALIQDGPCFTALQRGTPTHSESFEPGTGDVTFDRYFWPAGGSVSDGKLKMFWMEMVRDPVVGGPLDGVSLHPQSTWLATYDVTTMQRLDFQPAAAPGVSPVYGYSVTDDGEWSYLFGNSALQNLALEGGFGSGPHSATRMYLSRVPRGQLEAAPTYWNGTDFTADPTTAAPISSRFFTENSMLPLVAGGRWISATKVDGFLGTAITIDVADHPWGPYTTLKILPATPRGDPTGIVTYHAIIVPWLDPSGALIVSLSQIPPALGADDAPARYRPNFFTVTF